VTVTREGGCACGAVRYAVDGPLRDIVVCHCDDCRKATGHAWAATAAHRRDVSLRESEGLRWRRTIASTTGARRGRCYRCRTVVFWEVPGRDTVSIGVSTLDDPSGLVVGAHIWATQADAGFELPDDGTPAYPRGIPPGDDAPALRWV
jgi:hypothetical protein